MQWPTSRWIDMMSRPSWKAPSPLGEPRSVWSSPLNRSRNHPRSITTITSSWLNATATTAVAITSISVQCHPSLLSPVVCHSIQPPLLSIITTSSSTSTPATQVCPMLLVLLRLQWQLQCRYSPRLLISSSGLTNPIDQPQNDIIAS